MNLRSNCILWTHINPPPEDRFPAVDRDLRCEVAVIGGGISGALAAWHLIQAGVDAILIDRRQIANGSTAASTGLLQYEIDTPLIDLSRMIGRDRAAMAYHASLDALLAFEPLVEAIGDRAGLVARPSLYLSSSERDVEKLRDECLARKSIGIDVTFLDQHALQDQFGIARPGAILSRQAFEVDPLRLTWQLIRKSVAGGLRVFTHSTVERYESHAAGVTVHTTAGPKIEAKTVIFATGYEAAPFLPKDLSRLVSTFAVATEPMANFSDWRDRALLWESARPYFYARTTQDNRIVIGGADVPTTDPVSRDGLINSAAAKLIDDFKTVFPSISLTPFCAWAGVFAETQDGLPYIGPQPSFPNAYFALGYGGNGITFSLLAAQLLRDRITRRANPLARLFSFERSLQH